MWSLPVSCCPVSRSLLSSVQSLCSACALRWFVKCGCTNTQAGKCWWQTVTGGQTVGTPSHCPQWLPVRFPHAHILRRKNYYHADTNLVSQGGQVKNRVQGKGKRKGRQAKPCQTPSGQNWHCVIQSCVPHPTWSLLNTISHSLTHKNTLSKPA